MSRILINSQKQQNHMGKIIQIEVPEEVAKFIEKNARLKEKIVKKIIEETVYDKMIKEGKVSKEVINFLVQEEDVSLEDEEEILLRETKKKERERVKWL
jgi:hypothetical protein